MLMMVLLFGGRFPRDSVRERPRAGSESCVRNGQAYRRSYPLLRREARDHSRVSLPSQRLTRPSPRSRRASPAPPVATQYIAVFDELWGCTSASVSPACGMRWSPRPRARSACSLTVTYAGFAVKSHLLEELYARGMAAAGDRSRLARRRRHAVLLAHPPIAPWQTSAGSRDASQSAAERLRAHDREPVRQRREPFVDWRRDDQCVRPELTPARGTGNSISGLASTHPLNAIQRRSSPAPSTRRRRVCASSHTRFAPTLNQTDRLRGDGGEDAARLERALSLAQSSVDPFQLAAVAQRLEKSITSRSNPSRRPSPI